MDSSLTFLYYISIVSLALSSSVSRADYGEVKLFRRPERYSVESTVLLNDAARRDKEVSYKVKAALDVSPAWSDHQHDHLLKFELTSPQLYSRGKHENAEYAPSPSIWDSYPYSTFYAHWKDGIVQEVFLDPEELLDIQNFKRSLISLFQFQVVDGERNETDISGTCKVVYETVSMQVIRKFKSECAAADWAPGGAERGEAASRRATRVSLGAALDAADDLYAEEVHVLGAAAAPDLQLKARAWLYARRQPGAAPPAPARPPSAAAAAASLAAARAALAPRLSAAPLAAPAPPGLHALLDPPSPQGGAEELEAALRAAAALGGAGAGGGGALEDARAALRLRAALRRPAPAALSALAALLHDAADPALIDTACSALGGSEDAAAHALAARFLRLRDGDVPERPALAYLAALALAPRAPPAALAAAARLADEARLAGRARLAEAALLAAAHPSQTTPARLDHLNASLARCKDDECQRVRLHALANLRRADTADLLLDYAERAAPAPALAALDALAALPAAALRRPARLPRLERLALEPRALELRAAALDLLLRLSAHAPFALPRVLLALRRARAPSALRRLAWQRMRALAPRHAALRDLLRLLPRELRGWDEQARDGTSTVLERELGAAAGWSAVLESVQLERGGALRRGQVRLLARPPGADGVDNEDSELLAVELWTRGLESFAGTAPPGDDAEAEEMSGGLALSVGGVRLPAITLFSGQGELLGHVWAGTGSEPTPVVRATRATQGAGGALALLGGASLVYRREGVLALALDAQAQVSLWSRSARTALALRAALLARAEARAATAWVALSAEAALEVEPRLRVSADADFYERVSLCVRASTAGWARRRATRLSASGARGVRRARAARWAAPGRTLALGAPNDATCRALGAADDA